MKKYLLLPGVVVLLIITSCSSSKPIARSVAYKGMYDEKPLTVLLMPPINNSTNVEAKEYFHSTLNIPIDNAGFYVIPPILSMEILRKESAYDAELFLNSNLSKFGEIFGADLVLFTVINKWDKSGLAAKVYVDVEYIMKSTKTNEILYTRKGSVTYDASVSTGAPGAIGALANMAASAINTATTKYVDVARACNAYTFKDLPNGKYSPLFGTDATQLAGSKEFKATLNTNYR
ncbi:MAG: GNA1162 family protein [Bacteroidota bacterium]